MASGLPWFRMDSDIYVNDKILEVVDQHGTKGKAALAVYLFALGYSASHLTDGLIKRGILRAVHGSSADARILVEAGLFEDHPDGWIIRNYYYHQPSRKTAEELSQVRSEAGRKGAEARWSQ